MPALSCPLVFCISLVSVRSSAVAGRDRLGLGRGLFAGLSRSCFNFFFTLDSVISCAQKKPNGKRTVGARRFFLCE